jgi:hypothetical protein
MGGRRAAMTAVAEEEDMRGIWLALCTALLSGCGAGGGVTSTGSTAQPGTAIVEIATQAGSPATVMYAVEYTLRLPAGVTLATAPSSAELAAGVLQAADGAALAGGRYLPATAQAQGALLVNIADPVGFTVGPLATINCSVAPGASVSAAGFTLEGFSARDSNGAVIPDIIPRVTLKTQ